MREVGEKRARDKKRGREDERRIGGIIIGMEGWRDGGKAGRVSLRNTGREEERKEHSEEHCFGDRVSSTSKSNKFNCCEVHLSCTRDELVQENRDTNLTSESQVTLYHFFSRGAQRTI